MTSLTHEMHRLTPVGGQLMYAIVRKLIPLGWMLESTRGGYNSYRLEKAGKVYHLRSYHPYDTIEIRLSARGSAIEDVRTRSDILRFVEKLAAE